MPLDIGTQEVALIFSGIVCLVGVLGFRTSARDRQLAEMKEIHAQEIETHKWRTEMRGSMAHHAESLNTIKTEQRALRDEVRENAKTIHELESRHVADVQRLSGRIDQVDDRIADLLDVKRTAFEQETEDKQ